MCDFDRNVRHVIEDRCGIPVPEARNTSLAGQGAANGLFG